LLAYFAWTIGYNILNLLENIIGGTNDPLDILNYFLNQNNDNPEDFLNQSNNYI